MTTEVTSVEHYTKQIQASWHKTVESILETACLCAEANSNLTGSQKEQLFEHLPFNKSTFSKLAKIGDCSKLQEKPVLELLPPNYTIIYEAALLSDAQLESAIDEGVLSPEATRADLERWRKEQKVGTAPPKVNRMFASIRLPINYPEDRAEALEAELEKIRETFRVNIDRPRTAEEKAHDQYFDRLHKYVIAEARRRV